MNIIVTNSSLILLIAFCIISNPVNAAVFKCKNTNGEISFQAKPCRNNENQTRVKIKHNNPSNGLIHKNIFQQIKVGMGYEEVLSLLGKPIKRMRQKHPDNSDIETEIQKWHYEMQVISNENHVDEKCVKIKQDKYYKKLLKKNPCYKYEPIFLPNGKIKFKSKRTIIECHKTIKHNFWVDSIMNRNKYEKQCLTSKNSVVKEEVLIFFENAKVTNKKTNTSK